MTGPEALNHQVTRHEATGTYRQSRYSL